MRRRISIFKPIPSRLDGELVSISRLERYQETDVASSPWLPGTFTGNGPSIGTQKAMIFLTVKEIRIVVNLLTRTEINWMRKKSPISRKDNAVNNEKIIPKPNGTIACGGETNEEEKRILG